MPNKYREESIFTLNRDVEHIVNAAARYGAYGYGGTLPKRFAMLVTTDIHRCAKQMRRATEYLDGMDALDVGICLGDLQGGNYAESDGTWYTNIISQTEKPFYTVIGNHDGGNSTSAKISATKQEVFTKFILPTREQMGLPELDKTYYAVDFDEYKLTLIVLDNYDVPDERDENGDFLISRGVEMIGQEQADWLVEALGQVPADYHLIIARHNGTGVHIATPCNWTQEELPTFGAEGDGITTDLVPDLVNAWMNGESIEQEYFSKYIESIKPIKVNADYTQRGAGIFVGYIVGHTHRDWLGTCKKYPEQNIVYFASSANDDWQNYDCDLPRARGTKAEDCFSVLSVDTEKRFVYLVRVGSNITDRLVERTYYKLPY